MTVICSLFCITGVGGDKIGDKFGSLADFTIPPICTEPKAKPRTNADPQFTNLQHIIFNKQY